MYIFFLGQQRSYYDMDGSGPEQEIGIQETWDADNRMRLTPYIKKQQWLVCHLYNATTRQCVRSKVEVYIAKVNVTHKGQIEKFCFRSVSLNLIGVLFDTWHKCLPQQDNVMCGFMIYLLVRSTTSRNLSSSSLCPRWCFCLRWCASWFLKLAVRW